MSGDPEDEYRNGYDVGWEEGHAEAEQLRALVAAKPNVSTFDAVNSELGRLAADASIVLRERDEARAEVERLTQRKFDLETEVFSLREALRQITLEPYEDVSGLDQGCLNLHEARTIARSALSREDARNA